MSAIKDIRQSLKPELERLDTIISRTLDSSNPLMDQVISNYLSHKGKQLRPMLVMLTAKLFGGVNDLAVTAAASVEILHNASLIHDDVVDDSRGRRGLSDARRGGPARDWLCGGCVRVRAHSRVRTDSRLRGIRLRVRCKCLSDSVSRSRRMCRRQN